MLGPTKDERACCIMDFSKNEKSDAFSRRRFLAKASQGILASSLIGFQSSLKGQSLEASDNLKLPPTEAETEGNPGSPSLPMAPEERVGFAIIGLGNLALQQILPAFGESKM